MTQAERRLYLIRALLDEQPAYRNMEAPAAADQQRRLLRSLFNIRMPRPVSREFLIIQDAYLQQAIAEKGITDISSLTPVRKGLYLWKGDITTLRCDAIVNAANSRMLGCFAPCHGCIDNAIHTYAGVQLRLACAAIMERQGHPEETGRAKITPAFNLPCKYVLHTVGPIVDGRPTGREEKQLAACYASCLELADRKGAKSLAFCCISTGEFHFPPQRAAEIALAAMKGYKAETNSTIEVIFNVFTERDYAIYRRLFGAGA